MNPTSLEPILTYGMSKMADLNKLAEEIVGLTLLLLGHALVRLIVMLIE